MIQQNEIVLLLPADFQRTLAPRHRLNNGLRPSQQLLYHHQIPLVVIHGKNMLCMEIR